ncbi:MAG: tRNA (adenosine(37)-N6)-threonylcarbamoyltransferase complex ATPase subunit type 1 TsaE [bacterium]|nr:tRNA (adenosine(37)-N6)-threonylcarbamoyltransferase complex ATPase subunit type 1 TsaE [bacterium]
MEFLSKSLEDTKRFAKDFLEKLSVKSDGKANVVGLYGNLGSGKTTFTQCLAEILGVTEHLTSPTFVILKRFEIPSSKFKNLIHIDVYRLKSGEELRKLGFEKLLADPTNLILIEWADLVADILPQDHLKLRFEFVDEQTRKITSELLQ